MEELVILLGISLDIFGTMECQGSLIAKIEKGRMIVFSGILAVGQMLALGIGGFLSQLLCQEGMQPQESRIGRAAAAAIFLCLGIRLFLKAWQNERIVERRKEIFDVWGFIRQHSRSMLFTLLAGLALGFLGNSISVLLVMILILTVLAAVIGTYTGYRLGFEQKVIAYAAGGLLLLAGSMDVLIKYVI